MKALYFDCSSGISGDMVLGALLDLGIDPTYLIDELKGLHVEGYEITTKRVVKNGISANQVQVHLTEEHTHHHGHSHGGEEVHHHDHRNLADICHIIEHSHLEEETKDLAMRIFTRVAKAEAKVHGKALEEVHFHEVGAIDSIVDIIGCAILIRAIAPDAVYASVVNDGYGFVHCQHGQIPVPVPATSEIFADSSVVARQIDIDTELVTPTGAAIIAELAEEFGPMPAMKVKHVGWGSGQKELKIPNVLKVSLGEMEGTKADQVTVLETNVDDCTGEMLGYTMEKLFEHGALDAFYTPIYMKKNRPAYRLTVVASDEDVNELELQIFRHTTTIGIRKRREERTVLEREISFVDTSYGRLTVKRVYCNGEMRVYPEYESARLLAESSQTALRNIYEACQAAVAEAEGQIGGK